MPELHGWADACALILTGFAPPVAARDSGGRGARSNFALAGEMAEWPQFAKPRISRMTSTGREWRAEFGDVISWLRKA